MFFFATCMSSPFAAQKKKNQGPAVLWIHDPWQLWRLPGMDPQPTAKGKQARYIQWMNETATVFLVMSILYWMVCQHTVGSILILCVYGGVLGIQWWQWLATTKGEKEEEGFTTVRDRRLSSSSAASKKPTKEWIAKEYYEGGAMNPLGNVLLTDIVDRPDRKSAPPAFSMETSEAIDNDILDAIQSFHPDLNVRKDMYGNALERFHLKQANRAYYSMPSTQVADDQGALADFLYGNFASGKEATVEGGVARMLRNERYLLY